MSAERITKYEPPFIDLPSRNELLFVPGIAMPAYKYVEPKLFMPKLKEFCDLFDFSGFDGFAYNLNGGKFPAELIKNLVDLRQEIFPIEYHRDGSVITKIPEKYKGLKLLVFEDVFDTGTSNKMMKKHCPGVHLLVMSQKIGVPNQGDCSNVTAIVKTVIDWQAGMGMNMDFDGDPFYPKDAFRTYPGLVIRPPDEVLEEYI